MFLEGRAYFECRAADGDGTGHFARDWKTKAEEETLLRRTMTILLLRSML